jgi:hypothetical protein
LNRKSILIILLLLFQCGLFHKGTPKTGTFCDSLVRPPQCIHVDFEKSQVTDIDGLTHALKPHETRLHFGLYPLNGSEFEGIELLVRSEHRMELLQKSGNTSRIFLRVKKEFHAKEN